VARQLKKKRSKSALKSFNNGSREGIILTHNFQDVPQFKCSEMQKNLQLKCGLYMEDDGQIWFLCAKDIVVRRKKVIYTKIVTYSGSILKNVI
jgi:hypothetical protein